MTYKLNVINAHNFNCTCGGSPTQYEFEDDKNRKYYFRYRFGYWELCDNTDGEYEKIIAEGKYGNEWDGCMSESIFKEELKKAGYMIRIVGYKQIKA